MPHRGNWMNQPADEFALMLQIREPKAQARLENSALKTASAAA